LWLAEVDPIHAVALFFCGIWVFVLVFLLWTARSLPRLREETATLSCDAERWPRLSIIVPACNEAGHVERSVSTLLAQDYPDAEVIAIDDRSSDATGEILDRLAQADARLRVRHITELPRGWLGKVHALHQGVQSATGDWYLFTDADVYFAPGALRRAVCYARHQRADHLACVPRLVAGGFWVNVAMTTFGMLFLLTTRAPLVNRPNSRTPVGIGAFNLVKVEMFRRTPGFEWLRMEPADDYGLGLMINEAGGRTRLVAAEEDVSVPWYESLRDMIRGVEKNAFGPGAQYRWWRLLPMVAILWGLAAAPVVALVAGIAAHSGILLGAAGAVIAGHIALALPGPSKRGDADLGVLFLPLGMLVVSVMMLRSAYRCTRNGGIDWRGTHYSIAELRAGQRVRL